LETDAYRLISQIPATAAVPGRRPEAMLYAMTFVFAVLPGTVIVVWAPVL
jgi:hypothetical protein